MNIIYLVPPEPKIALISKENNKEKLIKALKIKIRKLEKEGVKLVNF